MLVFWLILVTNVAFPMYGGSVINAYVAVDLHLSRSSLGTAFAIFSWVSGLPAPLVALCVNKKGIRFTILLGSLLLLAGALAMALFVHTALQLIIVFGVVIGAGLVTGGPLAAQTGITRWFARRRALAISLVLTGPTIGGFIAPVALNRLITAYHGNWRAAWWMIAGLNLIALLLTVLFVKESPSDLGQFPDGESGPAADGLPAPSQRKWGGVYRTAEEWTFSEIVRSPKFWLMLVAALGFYVGFTMFLAQGVIHLRDLGYTPAEAAWSFSVMLLALLGGSLVVAATGDHIEPRFLWAVASCAFGVGILLALKATGVAGLYLYAIFFGCGFGMAFSATMILPSNYFGQKAYASVVGIMFPIQTTLGALGAFGAGYAYDRFGSYALPFYTVAILSLVGAVVALFLTPPARKAAQLPGGHPVAAVRGIAVD